MAARNIISNALIASALLLFCLHNFLVFKAPSATYGKDWLGLTIFTPPTWTASIPYLGYLIEYVYQLGTMHGIIGLAIYGSLFAAGLTLRK